MQLQEVGDKVVVVQPPTKDLSSDGSLDVDIGVSESEAERGVDRDMLEILRFGGAGNSSESHGDPCDCW